MTPDSTSSDNALLVSQAQENLGDRVKQFDELLDQIDNTDDKKKRLWKEIYENSITDRQNAYAMFMKLVELTADKGTEHAVHGKTMVSYLERMSRATDQLIKLAELVTKAEQASDHINSDDMFDQIRSKKR